MMAGRGAFGAIELVLMVALLAGYEGAVPAYAAQAQARVHSVTDGDTVV